MTIFITAGASLRAASFAAGLLMLSGCTIDTTPTQFPDPLREPLPGQSAYNTSLQPEEELDVATLLRKRFNQTPGSRQQLDYVEPDSRLLGADLEGSAISLNVNNFPLPAFINEVFGNRLGLSFTMGPELQQKTDLVTLRLSEPQPPAVLFTTARNVLADYGVAIKEQEGVLYFQVANTVENDALPLLVSGGALPDVPLSHRPVFQLVPMKVVQANQMLNWLREIFTGNKLQVKADPLSNSIMLRGPVTEVKSALEAIALFDQPALKGSYSLAISPVFSDTEKLGAALVKVLQAEGYDVSETPPLGGTLVLTFPELRRIVVFTSDGTTLGHIRQWVDILDKESQEKIESGLFIYQVRNTQAAAIAEMLGALGYSASVPQSRVDSSNMVTPAGQAEPESATKLSTSSGNPEQGSVVVDANRNAIIFKGSGQEWIRLRPLMEELDKPVPSVMIDVLLAEVSLNDREGLGVDWRNIRTDFGARELIMGTANGLGSSGLNLTLNSAGQTRAVLNAFYENRQAVIRSSPKLMVRSGEEARIEVGNEIPVVTGTSQSTDNPNAPINKTVQYRKTGVILSIKPTVQASGLVDLAISQELSEQTDTGSGGDDLSPTIMNRKVETALTLKDGGSVMLAGLISSSKGSGDTGVPLLGDIPWLGNFFKSQSANEDRTELVVMIIPYVLRNFEEAQSLTERYRQQLELNNATLLQRRTLHLPQP